MQKDGIINSYIIRAIVETHLKSSKENKTHFSLVKFSHIVDLEDTYKFKDFISFVHLNTNFSPVLYQDKDSFLLLLKDIKIIEAKTMMKKIARQVENLFHFEIKSIGITTNDYNDTYKEIIDRVDKYFVMSKFSSTNNMFYGTVDFDFYDTIEPIHAIKNIFQRSNNITLNNIYKGIPISEEVNINGFSSGIMQVRLEHSMLPFYQNEKFTFIRHDLIPDVIKADILKVDQNKRIAVLGNLTFMPSSPVERSSARIVPEQKIHAILSSKKKKIMAGHITSISETSLSMTIPDYKRDTDLNKELLNKELNIQFQFINKKNFLSLIDIKAYLFDITEDNVILNILPGHDEAERIKHYISVREEKLRSNLKIELSHKKK
ncbi:MAG: hypothetical protein R3331_10865 [Sulfurospirillaceae bacterium]|nr:hypothetical protein [Sulfurospirillaceae bacterium]